MSRTGSAMGRRRRRRNEVIEDGNLYASYSESFNPQSRLDRNGDILPPLVGEQYEVGFKHRSHGGRLLLTAAAFQIRQTNEAQFDIIVAGQDRFRALGEVEHNGVELQALGQLTPDWEISA